jgi:hypothetical protein
MTRVTGTLLDDLYTFTISPSILKRIKKFQKNFVEKIKTHILCSKSFFFTKMVLIKRSVEKYGRTTQATDDNTIRCMWFVLGH